eukprot:2959986-Karenia_brevis.AAC.1
MWGGIHKSKNNATRGALLIIILHLCRPVLTEPGTLLQVIINWDQASSECVAIFTLLALSLQNPEGSNAFGVHCGPFGPWDP